MNLISRIKNYFNLPTIIIFVIPFIISSFILLPSFLKGQISEGDFIVGLGTLALAFATMSLVLVELEVSSVNRRINRIKDQLDRLYAPLYGIGEKNFTWDYKHREGQSIYNFMMAEIRNRYKYLASPELKKLLDDYYQRISDYKSIEEEKLKVIWKQIIKDFEALVNEYNSLTH